MKRSRKVFEMNEHELRSTLCTLTPEGDYLGLTKSDMQEELIYWLLLHGLTASHQFLLYEDEDGVVWLLDRGRDGCPCCRTPSSNTLNTTNLARPYDDSQGRTSRSSNTPLDVVIYRKSSESTFPDSSGVLLSADRLPGNLPSTKGPTERGQRVHASSESKPKVITTQPSMPGGKLRPKISETDKSGKKEKKPGCFRSCCIECGTCCVGLLGNA